MSLQMNDVFGKITFDGSLSGNYASTDWREIGGQWISLTHISPPRVDISVGAEPSWDDVMNDVMHERREAWEILALL